MLDLPGVVVAEAVGEDHLLERLLEQAMLVTLAPRPRQLKLVEDPEAHTVGPGCFRPERGSMALSRRFGNDGCGTTPGGGAVVGARAPSRDGPSRRRRRAGATRTAVSSRGVNERDGGRDGRSEGDAMSARPESAPPVIGLTGGIAAGKSTVSQRLAASGAHVIDADRVGHAVLLRGGEAYDAVVAAFGTEILDESKEIVRSRVGRSVFADPERLAALNRLTHPPMADRMRREIEAVRGWPSPPPFIVLDAAVLFEAGWEALCDEVWTVSTHPDRALERLVARNRLAPDAARARIEAQLGNAEREACADRVICNDGTLDSLAAAVDALAAATGGGACAIPSSPLG